MADTAHKTDAELVEHFDSPEALAAKLDTLASWVTASQHMVAFTGAGISTSAGIPDFRGPSGIWTMKAQGRKPVQRDYSKGFAPTAGHMGLVTLLEAGRLQHVISTNTDGIHRKSGLPADRLTEIHGNTNLEDCAVAPVGACEHPYAGNGCGRKYFRDGMCRRKGLQPHEHATGRTCTCGRPLQDTIINFNENLRQAECDAARAQAAAADLMVCVGSSLRISNWAPRTVVKNPSARLVVINLQWTPFEETADLVIHARSDEVFAGLQARLGLQPRQFQLTRYLRLRAVPAELSELKAAAAKAAAKAICGKVKVAAGTNGKAASGGGAVALERLVAAGATAVAVEVVCTDRDGATPDAIIKAATLAGPAVPRGHVLSCAVRAAADPTKLQLISQARLAFVPLPDSDGEAELTIKLSSRHDEPDIVLPVDVAALLGEEQQLVLSLDEEVGRWVPASQPLLPQAPVPTPLLADEDDSEDEQEVDVQAADEGEAAAVTAVQKQPRLFGRLFGN